MFLENKLHKKLPEIFKGYTNIYTETLNYYGDPYAKKWGNYWKRIETKIYAGILALNDLPYTGKLALWWQLLSYCCKFKVYRVVI